MLGGKGAYRIVMASVACPRISFNAWREPGRRARAPRPEGLACAASATALSPNRSPPEKSDHSRGDHDGDHDAHDDEDGAAPGATPHATSGRAGFEVHCPQLRCQQGSEGNGAPNTEAPPFTRLLRLSC